MIKPTTTGDDCVFELKKNGKKTHRWRRRRETGDNRQTATISTHDLQGQQNKEDIMCNSPIMWMRERKRVYFWIMWMRYNIVIIIIISTLSSSSWCVCVFFSSYENQMIEHWSKVKVGKSGVYSLSICANESLCSLYAAFPHFGVR